MNCNRLRRYSGKHAIHRGPAPLLPHDDSNSNDNTNDTNSNSNNDSTNENKHNDILGPFIFYYIHNKSMTHIMTYKHIHANLGNES